MVWRTNSSTWHSWVVLKTWWRQRGITSSNPAPRTRLSHSTTRWGHRWRVTHTLTQTLVKHYCTGTSNTITDILDFFIVLFKLKIMWNTNVRFVEVIIYSRHLSSCLLRVPSGACCQWVSLKCEHSIVSMSHFSLCFCIATVVMFEFMFLTIQFVFFLWRRRTIYSAHPYDIQLMFKHNVHRIYIYNI